MSNIQKATQLAEALRRRIAGETDALHTNAIAKEARGPRMGSTNLSSFDSRMYIEKNRQTVRGYRHSQLGDMTHPSRYQRSSLRQASQDARPAGDASVPKPPRFNEPTSRGYDPFA